MAPLNPLSTSLVRSPNSSAVDLTPAPTSSTLSCATCGPGASPRVPRAARETNGWRRKQGCPPAHDAQDCHVGHIPSPLIIALEWSATLSEFSDINPKPLRRASCRSPSAFRWIVKLCFLLFLTHFRVHPLGCKEPKTHHRAPAHLVRVDGVVDQGPGHAGTVEGQHHSPVAGAARRRPAQQRAPVEGQPKHSLRLQESRDFVARAFGMRDPISGVGAACCCVGFRASVPKPECSDMFRPFQAI